MTKSKVGLTKTFMYESQTLSYTLYVKPHLKNLYIQVHPEKGVIVKSPSHSLLYIEKVLSEKAPWILTKINVSKGRILLKQLFEEEGKILYLGEPILLHVTQTPQSFYTEKTIPLVSRLVEEWSFIMGVKPTKISFRKAKKRWGSCSYKNELSFNLTLAQLPLECITYIVIHELSHITHKHHQKAFWECVESFMPTYKMCEKHLKNYSPSLS